MMLERQIEELLRREVGKRGGLCVKFISPGNSGVPDRLVLLPDIAPYFIELKAPGRKPRKLQVAMMRRIRDVNCLCGVAWLDSAEKIKGFMAYYDASKQGGRPHEI